MIDNKYMSARRARDLDPMTVLAQVRAVTRSIVQNDAFIVAFNNASFAIALSLLISVVARWIAQAPKSISTPVSAH